MRLSAITRLPVALLLLAGLTLTLAPQAIRPSPAAANTLNTATVCGTVTGYIGATSYSAGAITIGGVTYGIAAGTAVTNAGVLISGGSFCLQAVFDANGNIVSFTVVINNSPAVSVCGVIGEYIPPTFSSPGYIVVDNTTYPIAPGVTMIGVSLLGNGSTPIFLCLQATLNVSGEISVGSLSGGAGVGGPVHLCGTLINYVPPSYLATGTVTIDGRSLNIAPGAVFTNAGALIGGTSVCLDGTLNNQLQITSATISSNQNFNVITCGVVQDYTPATFAAGGELIINNQTYLIAPGSVVTGTGVIGNGVVVCLNGTLDAAGEIESATLTTSTPVTPPVTQPVSVCGVVTDYAAASTSAGLLSIAGASYPVAPGVTITGASLLTSGTNVCLQATLNSAGQISSATVTYNGALQVTICGVISAYTPASAVTAGSITIAGITFPLGAGLSFGSAAVATGGIVGITVTLNGQGVVNGGSVTATSCTGQSITGPISNYVPPTGSTVGSITIGGATYPVAAGTTLTINNGPPLAASLYQPHGRYHLGF